MPGKLPGGKKTDVNDSHPFGMSWLDSCYQETLLPNGPWQTIVETIHHELAEKMKKQLDIPERRQMLFELLGQQFVQQYFPNESFTPHIIAPPKMTSEARKKLQIDAQNWLQNAIYKIALDTGSHRSLHADQSGIPQSEDMKIFLKHTELIFNKGMNRQLYLQERDVERRWEEIQWQNQQAREAREENRERLRLRQEYERLRGAGSSTVKSILRTQVPPSTAGSVSSVTENVKGAQYGLTEDPPAIWGNQSNFLGRSIKAVLQRDPRRFAEVVGKLHGRQLPGALRTYIWVDVLQRVERQKLNTTNIEAIVRDRFGKAVAKGVDELKIKRATTSTISGLIEKAVMETYSNTPAMRMFLAEEAYTAEACKALNIMYVYDRTYEPYLIYWLFPMQLAFQDTAGQSEHCYELAMYLNLLNYSCFPKWPQIFAIAESAMERLEKIDKELHDHLKRVAQIKPNVNSKEFMIQMIHEEKSQAEAILRSDSGSRHSEYSTELLADPLVFLRRWVGEGFVGVLDTQAAVYVWDQCFMQKWATKVLEDVCLALLLLLRYKFMVTKDYSMMRAVFLNEPCKLYTMDLQRAWVHIQNNGELDQVHYFNRQRPRSPIPMTPEPEEEVRTPVDEAPSAPEAEAPPAGLTRSPSIGSEASQPQEPLSVGLSHVHVKLVLPKQAMSREPWLKDISTPRIQLVCIVYYGDVQLGSITSTTEAKKISDKTDAQGTRIYQFDMKKQKFVFADLDLGTYDLEREMGGSPFAVIRVEYIIPGKSGDALGSVVPLGKTSRIPVFEADGNILNRKWKIRLGSDVYPLIPVVSENEDDPNYTELVGPGSELSILVFDPMIPPRTPQTPAKTVPAPTVKPSPSRQKTPQRPPSAAPSGLGINDPFDLYIDGVDNIPDSASIVKVTGRFIKTGSLPAMDDLLGFPKLDSSARSPRFTYRLPVNTGKVPVDVDMLLLLRLYTVDIDTSELVVVGSCLVAIYDDAGQVRLGGHKRPLHFGMPDLKNGIEPLDQYSLDSHPRIPACWIYLRLAKHTETEKAAPELTTGHYPLDGEPLNSSELRVADSYMNDAIFPATEELMAKKLLEHENNTDSVDIEQWRKTRLDHKQQLPPNMPAGNLELTRLVQYRIARGLSLKVVKGYGMPAPGLIQVFGELSPGKYSANFPKTTEGWGGDERFMTSFHDLNSLQTSPVWIDKVREMHPYADRNSLIVFKIFKLDHIYVPQNDGSGPGIIKNKSNNQPPKLEDKHLIGWAVLPLFDKTYLLSGEHHIPVFSGRLSADLQRALQDGLPEDLLKDHRDAKQTKIKGAALVVKIWDNHFKPEHLLGGMQRYDFLLESVGTIDEYNKTETAQTGEKISQLVIDGLPTKEKKKGVGSLMYATEKQNYQTAMAETFQKMLKDAGYGKVSK